MKKAEVSVLMYIILAIVVGVVVLKISQMLLVGSECGAEDIRACRLSVITAGTTRPLDQFNLACTTCFADSVEAEANKDKAMKRISNLLYECYYEFGEGQYDVFSAANTFAGTPQSSGLADRAHCFVCSQFNLHKAMDGGSPDKKITVQELGAFLRKDHYSQETRTVYEFLRPALLRKGDGSLNILPIQLAPVDPGTLNQLVRSVFSTKIILGIPLSLAVTIAEDSMFQAGGSDVYGDMLKHSEDPYAVVFYQISNTQWAQILGQLSKVTGTSDQIVPPAKVVITPLDKVQDLNCQALQG